MNASENFKKIIGYALLGMGYEAKKMQERIILRERFENDAMTFPEGNNPLRKHNTLQEQIQKHDELLNLMQRCQDLKDAISEKEMEIFAKWFKEAHAEQRQGR